MSNATSDKHMIILCCVIFALKFRTFKFTTFYWRTNSCNSNMSCA